MLLTGGDDTTSRGGTAPASSVVIVTSPTQGGGQASTTTVPAGQTTLPGTSQVQVTVSGTAIIPGEGDEPSFSTTIINEPITTTLAASDANIPIAMYVDILWQEMELI